MSQLNFKTTTKYRRKAKQEVPGRDQDNPVVVHWLSYSECVLDQPKM